MSPILGIWASGQQLASSTAFDSIATVNASSQSSITFSSIPSTYKHLQIRAFINNSGGNISTGTTFNGDTGANYARHILYGDGASAGAAAGSSTTSMTFHLYSGNTASIFSATVIDILDYANTNKYKTLRGLGGYDNNGSGNIYFGSGLWQNTNAITSITIATAGSTWSSGSTFALYGVK